MINDIFRGELVRLTAEEPETVGKAFSVWDRDSEFRRLEDNQPPRLWSVKKIKEFIEKEHEDQRNREFVFFIRTLEGDSLIGFVELFIPTWIHGDAWVGIGIGDRHYWGKGYGTDAMRLILRYAFQELNLNRVSLDVFSYNPRAIRSYEKAGFKHEGRQRNTLLREGSRADFLLMGILREEWLAQYGDSYDEATRVEAAR